MSYGMECEKRNNKDSNVLPMEEKTETQSILRVNKDMNSPPNLQNPLTHTITKAIKFEKELNKRINKQKDKAPVNKFTPRSSFDLQ